jgi:hypothetical protein
MIRQAVEAGRIDDAIRRTNELDPEVRLAFPFQIASLSSTRLQSSMPRRERRKEVGCNESISFNP